MNESLGWVDRKKNRYTLSQTDKFRFWQKKTTARRRWARATKKIVCVQGVIVYHITSGNTNGPLLINERIISEKKKMNRARGHYYYHIRGISFQNSVWKKTDF